MSHKAKIATKITDKESLKKALDHMGIKYEVASTTNGLKTKSGYGVTATVDIQCISDSHGTSMKSVGFHRKEDNTYEVTGDVWECQNAKTKEGERLDERHFNGTISKRYAYIKALDTLSKAGFQTTQDADFSKGGSSINFNMQSLY